MMNKIKLALLTATIGVGLTVTQAATSYNGDLVIGFTAQTGNDFEYDLGPASAITNGQTWDLSAPLTSFDKSTLKWGVIGDTISGNPKTVWATKAAGIPLTLNGNAAWSPINSTMVGIYSLFPAAGVGQSVAPGSTLVSSWNQQTIAGSGSTYKNNYMNPNATGITSNNFWKTVTDNTAPTLIGSFSLAANGVVTFNTVSTAPPAPTLTIIRSGDDNLISFLSANSGTYTLCFTNSTGLTAPVITWPTQAGTISGNGSTKTFTNTITDADRFYRVKAQ